MCDYPTSPFPPNDELASLFDLHHKAREDNKRGNLAWSAACYQAAQAHADWMARTNTMNHTGENRSSFMVRLRAAGFQGTTGGENIAFGQSGSDEVFRTWMNSRGHRANILNQSFSQVGLAYATTEYGRKYWCAVFAGGVEMDGVIGACLPYWLHRLFRWFMGR